MASPDLDRGSARPIFPALALFVTTAAFILTKTGRDALYVQEGGIYALPWAYIGIAALAPVFAGGILALMRWLGVRPARVASLLAMAAFQVGVTWIARPGGDAVMTGVFMIIPLGYGVLLSVVWLLGSELLEGWDERSRAASYAIFGAASMAGGGAGAGLARVLSGSFEPQMFFAVGAVGLVMAAGILRYAQRRFPLVSPKAPSDDARKKKGAMPSMRDIGEQIGHPYIKSLLATALAAGFVGVLIEFLFFYSVAASMGSGQENSAFFSGFYLTLTVGSLVLQLTATPLLQRFAGVRGSLLVLPISIAAGSILVVAGGVGLGYFGLRVLEGGLKSSVHRSNWEQTYGRISQAKRSIIKVIIEGMGVRMAEGVAGLLIVGWLHFIARKAVSPDPLSLNITLLAGVVGWLTASLALFLSTETPAAVSSAPPLGPTQPPEGCPVTATLGAELIGDGGETPASSSG